MKFDKKNYSDDAEWLTRKPGIAWSCARMTQTAPGNVSVQALKLCEDRASDCASLALIQVRIMTHFVRVCKQKSLSSTNMWYKKFQVQVQYVTSSNWKSVITWTSILKRKMKWNRNRCRIFLAVAWACVKVKEKGGLVRGFVPVTMRQSTVFCCTMHAVVAQLVVA